MSNEENKKKCPFCGAEINENAKKCPNCKKWLVEKSSKTPLIVALILFSIGILMLLINLGNSAYNGRTADSCFDPAVQSTVISIFKDKADWKPSKEEHLYFGGKKKVNMTEPEIQFVEPLTYDKGVNKFSCSARIVVEAEEAVKYSGQPENIERTTTDYDFIYYSYRKPDGTNEVIGRIGNSWVK